MCLQSQLRLQRDILARGAWWVHLFARLEVFSLVIDASWLKVDKSVRCFALRGRGRGHREGLTEVVYILFGAQSIGISIGTTFATGVYYQRFATANEDKQGELAARDQGAGLSR